MNKELSDLNTRFLSEAGMQSARDLLISKHTWFLHASDPLNFDSIKESGLIAKRLDGKLPEIVETRFGATAREVVCFRPIGTEDPTASRGTQRFLLAVHKNWLPSLTGLDWSYDGTWTLPDILKGDNRELTDDEIFYEVVRRRGSVLSYSGVPAAHMRVCCMGSDIDDPSTWPELIKAAIYDVVRI